MDGKRHIWSEGGTAASKTYSALQLLILIAQHSKSPILISVVAESVPHLKRGALRDFTTIMGDSFNDSQFNKTDSIYNFGKGKIEFFSVDIPSKLRGGRRDILFLNEGNNIDYNSFRELDARTRKCSIVDWNPTGEFWYHFNDLGNSPNSCYIHSTYKDALNVIPNEVINNILDMGSRDPNWENVYVNGLLGKIEGLVYPDFSQVDDLPEGGNVIYGLDFGFSNDFTALTKNVLFPGKIYSQELIYEVGMTNHDIAVRIQELGLKKHYDEIIADSSEPKSIEEICQYGWNVKGCVKGPDSVEYGHQLVRQLKQYWTKDSLNAIKDQRNFKYIADKNGRLTDKTTHRWSHCMDSRRYAVVGSTPEPKEKIVVYDAINEERVNLDI